MYIFIFTQKILFIEDCHLLSWRLTEEEESRWAWRSALSWGRGTVMLNLAWCVDIIDIVDTV